MTSLRIKPYALHRDERQSLQLLGAWITVMATSEQTGGVFNLFEVICPPDYATSLHIHYAEDVAVYILDGPLAFFWGNEKKRQLPARTFINREAPRMDSGWKAQPPRGFYI